MNYGEISIDELKQVPNVPKEVRNFLQKNKENAYTIQGILINLYGIKEKDVRGVSFKNMKKGLPTLYTKVRRTLEKLVEEGKANKKQRGHAIYYYLIKEEKDE